MSTPPMWRRYLRFWGSDAKADLDDELRAHLEMRVEENLARGLSPGDAYREARERFGDLDTVRAECRTIALEQERTMRRLDTLESLGQDLRFALRTLCHAPGFAAAAILSLALGIGANAAIFGLVDAVVLRPLPGIARPESLVEITGTPLSYPSVRTMREELDVFQDLAGYRTRPMSLGTGTEAMVVDVGIVSGNYFPLLGTAAALGRTFVPEEDQRGARVPVVVLGHGLWQRAFGGDSGVLGRTVRLNGQPFTVVGVAPRGFRGTRLVLAPEAWIPINAWPLTAVGSFAELDIEDAGWGWLGSVARLKPGVTREQAEARLRAVIAQRDSAEQPLVHEPGRVRHVAATTSAAALGGRGPGMGELALLLFAVVGLTLLIACANVAGLLLARASVRRREISVRLALGASRRRLVRQLLTESLVIGMASVLLALVVAAVGSRLLGTLTLPGGVEVGLLGGGLTLPMLGAALALTLVACAAFGLVPALQASRPEVAGALRDAGRGATSARARLRGALVVAQLAVCLVLLAGTGLFVRSLREALSVESGYDTGRIAVAHFHLGLQRYDAARARDFYHALAERVARQPGVVAVSWASTLPLTQNENVNTFLVPATGADSALHVKPRVNSVGPAFFRAMGLPLVRGRDFTADDDARAERVVIVDESAARRYWPNRDALGATITSSDGAPSFTVVGIARDAKYLGLDDEPAPFLYAPIAQLGTDITDEVTVIARTTGDPGRLVPALRAAARDIDREVPVLDAARYEQVIAQLVMPQRLAASLFGLFGALTLVLASVGVYGVMAYLAASRTREIGIRAALGAPRGRLVAQVLGGGLWLVGSGLAIGLALVLLAARPLASFLPNVGATDPWALGGSILLLGTVALVATYLPARRASRVDPASALRAE